METQMDAITLNGIEYVRKDKVSQPAMNTDGLKYVIVRTYSAGVFAGWLNKREGQEVELLNCRRLWRWFGAASPDECKFPYEVSRHLLTQAIEILDVTEPPRGCFNCANHDHVEGTQHSHECVECLKDTPDSVPSKWKHDQITDALPPTGATINKEG